jgi:hypothetical protein
LVGENVNEIGAYQDLGYVSAIEAAWRIMVGREPTARMIEVHLQGRDCISFLANDARDSASILRTSVSKLELYFAAQTLGPEGLRSQLQRLRYHEFFEQFLHFDAANGSRERVVSSRWRTSSLGASAAAWALHLSPPEGVPECR